MKNKTYEEKVSSQKKLFILIEKIQKENKTEDWEELIRKVKPLFIKICNKYNVDVDEYLYYVTYKCIRRFNVERKIAFTNYLQLAIENEIKCVYRDTKKHENILSLNYNFLINDVEEDISLNDIIVDNKQNIEDIILTDMLLNDIEKILKPNEILIFKNMLEGKKHREIANMFGKTQPTITRSIKKIREKIKIYLESKL